MGLTAIQRRTVRKALQTANKYHASKKVKKADIEAGLTESQLQPLDHGDRDSEGYLQQRPSQGWGSPKQVRNVGYATKQFVTRANPIAKKYGSAGQLAQAVQRSATPDYFGKKSAQAEEILRKYDRKGGGPSGAKSGTRTVTKTGTVPGKDNSGVRQQLIGQYFSTLSKPTKNDPYGARGQGDLATLQAGLKGAQDTPSKTVTVKAKVPGVKGSSSGKSSTKTSAKGTAKFEGKTVAAWIKPELEYARKHGWKGSVNSGFRSLADQTRIYNSGVRPAAKPGTSNHEGADYPRGAVDVSDAAQLSRILSKKGSKLVWAGSKDPVHFSHPHGGSY